MAMIELENVAKTYRTNANVVHALRDCNLHFNQGVFTAIMGASGSGKSTLLHILGLMDRPTSGLYRLDGQEVSRLNDAKLSLTRCLKIGMVFQSFNLFSNYTIADNVAVPMRYAGAPKGKIRDRVEHLLRLVGLGERMDARPTELSGGQCQRVAIARALANDPPVLLADEPTGNLDQHTGEEIMALFQDIRRAGRTVIMVTHNPDYMRFVDRVIMLQDGFIDREINLYAERDAENAAASHGAGEESR
ncbi:ABC transporter ATP-binding protein [Candidatus Sumerlaeota bacterium]|nr:ABC transporter ATP-binding protein [Candidatus Sumerlaeota bacterium]